MSLEQQATNLLDKVKENPPLAIGLTVGIGAGLFVLLKSKGLGSVAPSAAGLGGSLPADNGATDPNTDNVTDSSQNSPDVMSMFDQLRAYVDTIFTQQEGEIAQANQQNQQLGSDVSGYVNGAIGSLTSQFSDAFSQQQSSFQDTLSSYQDRISSLERDVTAIPNQLADSMNGFQTSGLYPSYDIVPVPASAPAPIPTQSFNLGSMIAQAQQTLAGLVRNLPVPAPISLPAPKVTINAGMAGNSLSGNKIVGAIQNAGLGVGQAISEIVNKPLPPTSETVGGSGTPFVFVNGNSAVNSSSGNRLTG